MALLGASGAPIAREARAYLPGVARVVLDTDDRAPLTALREAQPDVILSAAHHYMIGPKMRATARLGAVGLHPSLLPSYRGSYPLWWALRAGEHEVGISLYHLNDEMDAGDIIAQRGVPVDRLAFGSLYDRVAAEVPGMLAGLLEAIEATGKLPVGVPQTGEHPFYRSPSTVARAAWKARWAIEGRR